MKLRKIGAALAAVAMTAGLAWAANIPLVTGPQDVNNLNNYLNTLINSINSLVTPNSMAPALGYGRNALDNGAMGISQRGTTEVTCALNGAAITSAAYIADRWGCDVNVAVGAGFAQVVTTGPTPPAGFTQGINLYRKTGALTQPVCMYQEIGTAVSTALAGQSVVLSVYAAVLAGGPTTPTFNAYVMTGTGTDQGFGTWTASPAITPAWTGIATPGSFSGTATATPTRYTMGAAVLGSTVTEIAVALCFTPAGETAGTTDGFYFTGIQLEPGTVAQGPSTFEFRNGQIEQMVAYRYYWQVVERTTAPQGAHAACANSSSSLAVCYVQFPVQMRAAPTLTFANGFALTVAAQTTQAACSVLRLSTTNGTITPAATVNGAPVDCTSSAAFGGAGTASALFDGAGTGSIKVSADY